MIIIEKTAELQDFIATQKTKGKSIGFVPTMGALHQGHLDLMRRAIYENDMLVVSIFVNPIQFNNPADLEKYPRPEAEDEQLLRALHCDVLFRPAVNEMYPQAETTTYDFGKLAESMEGKARPGHFNGVAIVVRKLFEMVQPHRAYFGEKDFQQLAVVRQMVRMLKMDVEVVGCETVREADGLAMSSRNRRLSRDERKLAPELYAGMRQAAAMYPEKQPAEIKQWLHKYLEKEDRFKIDYIEIADETKLQPLSSWPDKQRFRLFAAVFLGEVRLIDNIRINS